MSLLVRRLLQQLPFLVEGTKKEKAKKINSLKVKPEENQFSSGFTFSESVQDIAPESATNTLSPTAW
ncbi:hypothetical protein AusDCA_2560 [Desulfitobacterium sp. AusDCA]